jgi:hypothetical protein
MNKKYYAEDLKKPGLSAAEHFESTASQKPPAISLTNRSNSNQSPIQGKFSFPKLKLKKKKGKGSKKNFNIGPIDVAKTPAPGGSVPIPYPNLSIGGTGKKGKGKQGINLKTGVKPLNNLANGISSSFDKFKEQGDNLKESAGGLGASFGGSDSDYLAAVQFSHDMFRLSSGFRNVSIFGSNAFGNPGCLDGPELESNIKNAPSIASMTGEDKQVGRAVSKGVSKNFNLWKQHVTVPGLPWYPSFIAYPGPYAPPTPNVPTPLMSCFSSRLDKITDPMQLKSSIWNELPGELKNPAMEGFVLGLAFKISNYFLSWIASQQVMLVMGMGPTSGFVPPFKPVGTVTNGSIIPSKNHLIS